MDENGKRRSETYATYAEAKVALARHETEVDEIKRGVRLPSPPTKTFAELADYWVQNRLPHKRSPKDDLSILRRHLLPAFGSLLVRDITLDKVDSFVASKGEAHRKSLHNFLTLLITLLRLAVDLGWLVNMPRIRKPKLARWSKEFAYLKADDEIRRLLLAAREESELHYALYATAIYTGLRAGELAGLLWTCVDLEKRRIVVERSFDQCTKSGRVRYVPIFDPLLPILIRWRLQCTSEFVFPTAVGTGQSRSARPFQEDFRRCIKRAGLPRLRFHDLRHSFASLWVMCGGDVFKLKALLGHQDVATTQRYAHLAADAFTADLGRLGTQEPGQPGQLVRIQNGRGTAPEIASDLPKNSCEAGVASPQPDKNCGAVRKEGVR
ncbi:MAG: site-specific integrase [Myxococcales bacterium]|nr:site-specific integrase [Myxococcales bacterium]